MTRRLYGSFRGAEGTYGWVRALKPMIIYRLRNPKISSMCPRPYTKAKFQGSLLVDFLAQPPNRPKATMNQRCTSIGGLGQHYYIHKTNR